MGVSPTAKESRSTDIVQSVTKSHDLKPSVNDEYSVNNIKIPAATGSRRGTSLTNDVRAAARENVVLDIIDIKPRIG